MSARCERVPAGSVRAVHAAGPRTARAARRSAGTARVRSTDLQERGCASQGVLAVRSAASEDACRAPHVWLAGRLAII